MSIEWRFTDDQGVEHAVATDELRASLAGGTVAPSTLVWREGMKEWAPAFTVPELVPVLTGNRRGPIHTLSGIEPELMADALGKPAESGNVAEPTIDDPGAAPAAAKRDLAAITDDAEGWGDATDVIPKAPGVPLDAARNLPPRIHRRLPSLPPPPLPNIPTPPPPAAVPKVAERRQTLTGTGHRNNSKPPPPPRRASIPPGLATSTEAAPRPAKSEAPVPAQRRASVPPPPPRRLNKSLGPEAKPESLPPAVAAARTLVSPSSRAGAAPTESKGGAVVPRIGRTTALGLGVKQSTPPPANKLALTATPAPVQAAAAQPPGTLTPTVLAQLPPVPTASAPVAAPSAGSAPAASPAPAAGGGGSKSKELTEASSAFAAEMEKSRAAFSAEMRKSNLAKTTKGTQDPAAAPIPRSATLEMAAVDHSQAAAKDPNSPDMPPADPAPVDDEATAPIQIAKIVTEGEKARARKNEALVAKQDARQSSSDSRGMPHESEDAPASVDGSPTASAPASSARPSRAPSRRGGKDALEVPLSSLVAASALWVLGLVAFFFAGRVSGVSSAGAAPLAKDGIAKAFLVWSSAHAATGGPSYSEPKPCWVTRQPSKWVATASKSVPVDMRARDSSSIELGFAAEDHVAVGLRIDPRTGKPEEVFRKKVEAKITRVTPTGSGEGFLVNEEGAREYLPVPGTPPLYVSFETAALGVVDAPGGDARSLWTFDTPGEVSAATVVDTGGDYALTFRKDDAVWAGYFGKDKNARGALGRLTGSEGGKSGKPRSSFNGKEVAITFADKSTADGATYDIRLGRAPLGSLPTSTEIVAIPEGGPGGNAISPDLIGLPDGRWLLMWTEGRSGAWAIRAQTYNATMEPIGDPIALSPPAGSFGQAVLGVVGSYTTVAFLQAQDEGFELWGAVLQCGS